jgi:hypothetical protein
MAMTRKQFQQLAGMRAQEARALVKSGHENGAYYLGGFAIECAIKACIAKMTRRHDFPRGKADVDKVYSHNLPVLLKFAGLDAALDKDMKSNRQLAQNWGVIKSWDVGSRYESATLKGTDMVAAVSSKDGVLKWIKQHW